MWRRSWDFDVWEDEEDGNFKYDKLNISKSSHN